MTIQELEQPGVKIDLKRAADEVKATEERFKSAERALAAAETARMDAQRAFGRFNSDAALLQEKQKAAKIKAVTNSVKGDSVRDWAAYDAVKKERDHVIAVYEYITVFLLPDSERASLVAEIEERTAWADYLDQKVALQRAALATEMLKIADLDPGVKLQFDPDPDGGAPGSWSHGVVATIKKIRDQEVPGLRLRIQQHDESVEALRRQSQNSLFN